MKRASALVVVVVGLVVTACGLSRHYYVNVSPSLPEEGYWIWGMPDRRGDVVLGCLDEHQRQAATALSSELVETSRCGRAPGLLKIVVGLPGDHVHVDERGVWIAGRLLAASRPLTGLSRARDEVIPPAHAWLWSPVSASLDSRYLGSIRVLGAARPEHGFSVADADRLRVRWAQ